MWRGLLLAVGLVALLSQAGCGDGGPGAAKPLAVVGEPLVTRPNPTTVMAAGRVKNSAQGVISGIVTVTLFGADGKIVGTAQGAANSVAPGDEVTYQAMGIVTADAQWTRVEAKVTTQFAG